MEAGRSSVVQRPLMVQWVIGSISSAGRIELFHNWFSSSTQLVIKGRGMYYHVCDGAYKGSLAASRKEQHVKSRSRGFSLAIRVAIHHLSHAI